MYIIIPCFRRKVKYPADIYGSMVVTGIFSHIALQVILNVAVVTNLLPTTGITLPFISYGGTTPSSSQMMERIISFWTSGMIIF